MVQVLATIFFSAAVLAALAVIVATIVDNLADVRRALGLVSDLPALPARRVRVRRAAGWTPATTSPAGLPQRAVA